MFSGANQREPLWPTNFNQQGGIYQWLASTVAARRLVQPHLANCSILAVDSQFLAFARGSRALVLLTNQQNIARMARVVHLPSFAGRRLCNIYWPTADCIVVPPNGVTSVYLDGGEAKVYK